MRIQSILQKWLPAGIAAVFLLGSPVATASQYVPTPLSKSLAEHDAVLVVEVTASGKGKATVRVKRTIKGMTPRTMEFPDTWRPGTEFTFGPVRLVKGKTFLLMLKRDKREQFSLSKDFAAWAVTPVKSPADPLVRATEVLYELSRKERGDDRQQMLAEAWKKESDETRMKLLWDFYSTAADEATVPFLIEAMKVGTRNSSLPEVSALVIQKHKYKKSIPGLLQVLKNKDWACIYPARTLGKLGAKQAYEPIMELINDKKVGNREYFIHALCYLKDERSVAFLSETLELYRTKNWHLHYSWAEPLTQVLDIPDKKLRRLTVEALGRVGWRAYKSLPKIKQMQESLRDDAEFQRAAQAALRKIDLKQ